MSDTSFGLFLRQAREERGFTLEQAEEETKIRKFYLRALEEDNFSVMPAQVYAVGFVRKYCLFLGIDAQEMIHRYKQLNGGTKHEDDQTTPPIVTYQEKPPFISRVSTKNIAAALMFLVIVIWMGSYLTDYLANRANYKQPPVTKNPITGQKPSTKPQNPPPATKEVAITMTATAECWYSVQVDNGQLEQGTMEVGTVKEYRGKEKISVHLGNAGGVKIAVNGKEPVYLGGSGEVVKQDYTTSQ